MALEDNKDLSRRFLEELWNQNNVSAIDELLAENFVDHTPTLRFSDPSPQRRESLKELFRVLHSFATIRVSIEDQIAEEDRVTTRVTWKCTLNDANPFTSSQVTLVGVGIDRIDSGKIAESWYMRDGLDSLLVALDKVPCPIRPCPPGWICRSGECRPIKKLGSH
jgi:predicted ester cyclase